MAEIFRLPAVSPTMELGQLVAWRIQVGAAFASGDIIAEIGTDKATIEAEIYEEGTLLAQLVDEDEDVPVNAPIAVFGAKGEDASDLIAQAKAELASMRAAGEGPSEAPASDEVPAPDEAPAPVAAPPVTSPTKAVPAPSLTRTWMGQSLPPDFADPPGDLRLGREPTRVHASPLARAVADDLGVDLRRVQGSGPGGRIVQADVHAAAAAPTRGRAAPPPADTVLKLTPMRRTIAKRLLESHQDIPTFFLTVSLDAKGFVDLRQALKVAWPDVKISYNDLLLAAVARALRAYPRANVSWTDMGIVQHGQIDIGVAVALDEGLITPVLRSADNLGLADIGPQVNDLATRARAGKLDATEYTGNTFTVSNLGMYGIDHFTAIINPPASAILAVGALSEVPVVSNGTLTTGWRMNVTMTCDHRAIDGAVGAQFLQTLRRYVETPALLFV